MKPIGKYYWCIRVCDDLADNGEIFLHADSVEVVDGYLIFKREDGQILFMFSKGSWTCFYAASCLTGDSICVEHWKKD